MRGPNSAFGYLSDVVRPSSLCGGTFALRVPDVGSPATVTPINIPGWGPSARCVYCGIKSTNLRNSKTCGRYVITYPSRHSGVYRSSISRPPANVHAVVNPIWFWVFFHGNFYALPWKKFSFHGSFHQFLCKRTPGTSAEEFPWKLPRFSMDVDLLQFTSMEVTIEVTSFSGFIYFDKIYHLLIPASMQASTNFHGSWGSRQFRCK